MLRSLTRRLFFYALCLLLLFPAQGRPNHRYRYKQIGIEQGLSQSTVTALLRDSRGVLWIGTKSGLNRYDKSGIRTFFKVPGEPKSLPGNTVLTIAEDIRTNIWVGTNGGLAVYDPSLDRFTMRTDKAVYSSLNIGDEILFGGSRCIYRYRPADDTLTCIPIESEDDEVYSVRAICRDANGNIVLGGANGRLYRYWPKTGTFSRNPDVCVPFLYCMHLCDDGCCYISSYKEGLFRFDPQGRMTAHWTTANSGLSNNIITSILELDGRLWLSTDGGGICIFDPRTQTFTTLGHEAEDPNSIPTNSLTLLYLDYNDNLWAGTVRNGLLGIRQAFIKSFKEVLPASSGELRGLSVKSVTSLFEDADGLLWIGTDGGGMNVYDPRTDAFRHYAGTYGESIISITDLDERTLLISMFNKGVFLFSKATGRLTPFVIRDRETDRCEKISGITALIHRVGPDRIYIMSENIYIYRPSTGRFSVMEAVYGDRIPPALNLTYAGELSSYGVSENKVYEIDRQSDVLRRLVTLDEGENLSSLCSLGAGKLWIGSDWGLSLYDRTDNSLRRIPTKLFNAVSYMVADGPDRLWICANNMLFSYSVSEDKFSVWGESDGFSPNEIIRTFQNRPRGRYIYLGGVNGLVVIDRTLSSGQQDDVPAILLQEVMLNGKPCKPRGGNRFRIPHDYTSLSVSASTREKDIFRKVLFRYTIEGASVQTLETYDRSLNLPMLPPGDYVISAACNRKNGEWTEERELVRISVIPPWYKSGWASLGLLILVMLVVLSVIYYLYRRNERMFRWKFKEYEQEVNEKKIQFLVNVSHELRTPLTLIYAPLKRLIKGLDDDDPSKESLTDIYHQARYMKDVVNMVLDINKLESGGVRLSLVVRPFNEWLARLVESFEREFAENGIELEFLPDERIGGVTLDDSKLRIVVSNLLANALKFSPAGTTVTVRTELFNSMVRVSVSDQGIGLKNVDPDQLFTRFYQGIHNRKGSGIGLAYSRQLVELHGGVIRALENKSGGATFQFEIPIADLVNGSDTTADPRRAERYDEPVTFSEEDLKEFCSRYSILIVEDNTEFRRFMRSVLKDYFKSVYSAEDGEKGLEVTRSKRPDIVVSDVMMPCMNGFELCRRIKEDIAISHSMVILLTAMGDPESISHGYKLGADFYLAKPFEIDMLLTLIYNQLKSRERIRKNFADGMNLLSPEETTASSADEHFLQELNGLILENMDNQALDVNLLTEKMAMGRTTFYQKVKILTGMSVNDYVNKIRIGRAAHLLTHSAETVGEIADEVGFAYQRYFSTLFKQMTGMTPTEYRRSKGAENTKKSANNTNTDS